jgi:hypothetical protein
LRSGAERGILNKEGGTSVFQRIEGEHSIRQDLAATNPNFGTGKLEYMRNCGHCIVAYEMRRRGFDVEAMPRIEMPFDEWKGLFEGFTPEVPLSRAKASVVEELEQKILQWGEGARGTIYGAWNKLDAHYFSVEVSGGKVMFVDGQNGKDDVRGYLGKMMPSLIFYGRLDNLQPTDAVKNAVKNRERENDTARSVS